MQNGNEKENVRNKNKRNNADRVAQTADQSKKHKRT